MSEPQIDGRVAGFDGTSISYQIDGPKDAPWLILSNSLATDRSMWVPQMAALSASRRVLRYDTRGHGQSDVAEPPYTSEQLVGDVVALMDHLKIENADFMGLSLGGMTGLGLAVDHGSRVNRLVCADARADAPAVYREIWDTNIDRLHKGGIDALCEPTMERWFTEGFLKQAENADLLNGVRAMIRGTTPQGYEGVGRFLQQLDLAAPAAGNLLSGVVCGRRTRHGGAGCDNAGHGRRNERRPIGCHSRRGASIQSGTTRCFPGGSIRVSRHRLVPDRTSVQIIYQA